MDLRASRRRRFTPFAIAAGLVGSAVLGLGTTGTFSALTATITNTSNTAGTGTIVMQETDSSGAAAGSCTSTSGTNNSYSCTSFDKYGGSTTLVPGGATPSTKTIRIYNIGSFDASQFTLTPGACTVLSNPSGTAGNICGYLKVTLTCTVTAGGVAGSAVTVYDGTLAASNLTQIYTAGAVNLKTTKACTPAKTTQGGNNYTTFAFSVLLDSTAGNDVQGQTGTQQLEWKFQA